MIDVLMLAGILNSDFKKMTDRAIASIIGKAGEPVNVHVIVTAGWYENRKANVFRENLFSLAQGYNRMLTKTTEPYIAIAHNDIVIQSRSWVKQMTKAQTICFACPVEDDECIARGIPKTAFSPGAPSGCLYVFPRDLLTTIGLFDEQFVPFHFEDTDFWKRAKDAGYSLARTPVEVLHRRGWTRSCLPDKGNGAMEVSKKRYYDKYACENYDDYYASLPRIDTDLAVPLAESAL